MSKTAQFLATKRFHPGTRRNRTAVFEAEQRQAREEQQRQEREAVLNKEREMLDVVGPGSGRHALAFMYSTPRGLTAPAAGPAAAAEEEARARREQEEQQAQATNAKRRRAGGDDWCARCNVRGHTQTSDQCPLRAADPSNPFQARLEDPLALREWRESQLRTAAAGSVELTVTFQRKVDPNDPNNQLLEDDDDGDGGGGGPQQPDAPQDDLQVEREFLANLTEEQRAMLIKHFTRADSDDSDDKRRKKNKKKKHKKKDKKESKRHQRDGGDDDPHRRERSA